MKRFLLIFGLFLLFETSARAVTVVECKVANCKSCDAYKSGACYICNDGYLPYATDMIPSEDGKGYYMEKLCAKSNIEHCQMVEDAGGTNCRVCEKGYGRSDLYGKGCLPCSDENATECSGSLYTGSTACKSGYTLGKHYAMVNGGTCYKIVEHCTDYSGVQNSPKKQCVECESGYSLQDGDCVADDAGNSETAIGTVISCPDDMKLSADGCCCVPD